MFESLSTTVTPYFAANCPATSKRLALTTSTGSPVSRDISLM